MKEYTMWCIRHLDGNLIVNSGIFATRTECVKNFETPGYTWKKCYKIGYRCAKVIVKEKTNISMSKTEKEIESIPPNFKGIPMDSWDQVRNIEIECKKLSNSLPWLSFDQVCNIVHKAICDNKKNRSR